MALENVAYSYIAYNLSGEHFVSAFLSLIDKYLGCSPDVKIWNTCINTTITDAFPPSCSLRCLTIRCEELGHPQPVGEVIDHPLGAGRVRRISGDLIFDSRPAGSPMEKEILVRLDGEHFYKLQGNDMGLSRPAQNRRSIRNDALSVLSAIASKTI